MKRDIDLKKYFKEWRFTKNSYTSWVSNTKLRKFFAQNLVIRNFSIWWATSIVSKDNLNKKNWYINLNKKVNNNKSFSNNKINLFKFYVIFFLKFFKNFFIYIIWNIILKLISFSRFKKVNKENCFHSFNYNFFFEKKKHFFLDRCYKFAFSKNLNKNFYIISIINKKKFLLDYFNFKNKKVDYYIADEHINFFDILEIYIKTLFSFFQLINFLHEEKKIFYINNVNCENILKPFLISSFAGEIQNNILTSISVGNFLRNKKIKHFINYGEFSPGFRPMYHFVKAANQNIKIVTIQHGNASSNLIFNYNHKSEFSTLANDKGKYYSPSPDIYLTHGKQFNKNLNLYFKNSKIIGPLKYDFHLITKKEKKRKKSKKNTKNILICPSIGDHQFILNFLRLSVNFKHNYILSPHPVFTKISNKYLNLLKDKCEIKYYKNKTTYDLLKNADLVICGFSTIAHEAAFLGIPSVRILDLENPYFHDLQDKIKMVHMPEQLEKILKKDDFQFFLSNSKNIERKFYNKLDNKAYIRFNRVLKNK